MSIASLIDPITAVPGLVALADAGAWLQGRTLYGGASALIAYTAAVRAHPGLPPLRAAQVAFCGPVGEAFATRVTVLRAGRNVIQLHSQLVVEGAVGLAATLVFGAAREANAVHPAPRCDPWPGAPADAEPLPGPEGLHFINNFELRRVQGEIGQGQSKQSGSRPGEGKQGESGQRGHGPGFPRVRRWVRLRDAGGLDPVSQLVLIGDALPPGSMRAMQRKGPLSSVNWSFNILDPEAQSCDGWWLAESASDHADLGYSSERLRLWDADGRLAMVGMQAAAIFG